MNLYEELRMALIVLNQRLEVVHQRIINDRAVDGNRKLLQSVLLHGLQIFHRTDLEVEIVAVAIAGYALCRNKDGTSLHHDASPGAPVLTEESQFTRPLKVFEGNESTRLSGLGKLGFHLGDDAAEDDVFLLGKRNLVAQLRALSCARIVKLVLVSES